MANPTSEVMKKLDKAKFIESLGHDWIYLTIGHAVASCNYMLDSCKADVDDIGETKSRDNMVWNLLL